MLSSTLQPASEWSKKMVCWTGSKNVAQRRLTMNKRHFVVWARGSLLVLLLVGAPAALAVAQSSTGTSHVYLPLVKNSLQSTNEASQDRVFLDADENVGTPMPTFGADSPIAKHDFVSFGSPATDTTSSVLPSQRFEILDDELTQYAQACDQAIGVTVPDFKCDEGTEVPTTNLTPPDAKYPNGNCDRPNHLNQECDPGSHFQVLTNSPDAYVVAHCRKEGLAAGQYQDIAVIQYNRNNGATCFYQALGTLNGNVQAPSKGVGDDGVGGSFWMTPTEIRDSTFPCGSCHDNGPLIRSPYLAQITGANALPGAGDPTFNRDQPYYFVGSAFAAWKAYKVEVHDDHGVINKCNTCHRMGVSNLSSSVYGTALDFGIRATVATTTTPSPYNPHKNPDSANSPLWMPPGQTAYSQENEDAAQAIRACALRWTETPLPNSDACKITLFTGPSCAGPLYVDGAYRGLEQGTMTHPFRTVGAAYGYACNGAQLHVQAGTYSEVLTLSKNLTLVSHGGVATIGD
jgi:hypothetical protein